MGFFKEYTTKKVCIFEQIKKGENRSPPPIQLFLVGKAIP